MHSIARQKWSVFCRSYGQEYGISFSAHGMAAAITTFEATEAAASVVFTVASAKIA